MLEPSQFCLLFGQNNQNVMRKLIIATHDSDKLDHKEKYTKTIIIINIILTKQPTYKKLISITKNIAIKKK